VEPSYREVDHSHLYAAQVKNGWSCTSVSHTSHFCCLIKHRVKFTFAFRNSAVGMGILHFFFFPPGCGCETNSVLRVYCMAVSFSCKSAFIRRYRCTGALMRNETPQHEGIWGSGSIALGCKNPRRPGRLTFVRWILIFVGRECETCHILPFWRLDFRDGSSMLGKFVGPWYSSTNS
jgi:hypothetical protein